MANADRYDLSRGDGKIGVRADAQKNADAIVIAAGKVFAESGVNAPVREIAAQAGVGIATIYRRFPTRSEIVAAVFRGEVDACADDARKRLQLDPPVAALAGWLHRYTEFIATKRGLATALHSGDPAFKELPGYFRAKFEPVLEELLNAGAEAGQVRTDIPAYDILRAVGNLCVASDNEGDAHTRRMVDVLVDGLRKV